MARDETTDDTRGTRDTQSGLESQVRPTVPPHRLRIDFHGLRVGVGPTSLGWEFVGEEILRIRRLTSRAERTKDHPVSGPVLRSDETRDPRRRGHPWCPGDYRSNTPQSPIDRGYVGTQARERREGGVLVKFHLSLPPDL